MKIPLDTSVNLPYTFPGMNNEPKIELPQPPTGHVWQYRGEVPKYENLPFTGTVIYSELPHHWEAVASTPDTPIIEQLRTELDAKSGIVDALEEEVAFLKRKGFEDFNDLAHQKAAVERLIAHRDKLHRDVVFWQESSNQSALALDDAADLIYGIMRDEVNVIDECEKWIRAYAPPESEWPEEIDPPDYAAEAKDILQSAFKMGGMFRSTHLDTFVDLIIKAAKQ